MTRDGPPLLLSERAFALELGVGRDTVAAARRSGAIRVVPWLGGWRIPRAELERVAREGLTPTGRRPRARRASVRPGVCDPAALRALRVQDL
jgi:hypothetical protein